MNTPHGRLQSALAALGISAYQFSQLLGYKRPDSVYHVLNGQKALSENMIERIKNSPLEINTDWLITGDGEPLIKKVVKGEYGEEYFSDGRVIYPARINFMDARKLVKALARTMFGKHEDEYSYEVKVRPCAIEGLEIIYTTFTVLQAEKYLDKSYCVVVAPNWKVTHFYDYWRISQPDRRCQNLLRNEDIARTYIQSFECQIREILDTFTESYFDDMDEHLEIGKEVKDSEGFVKIYSTDIR